MERAHSHQGHGPRACQRGRIQISEFCLPARSHLRSAAGPYIHCFASFELFDETSHTQSFSIGHLFEGCVCRRCPQLNVLRAAATPPSARWSWTLRSRTDPPPPETFKAVFLILSSDRPTLQCSWMTNSCGITSCFQISLYLGIVGRDCGSLLIEAAGCPIVFTKCVNVTEVDIRPRVIGRY